MSEFHEDIRQFIADVFKECNEFQILVDKSCECVLKWGTPKVVQDTYDLYHVRFAYAGFNHLLKDLVILHFTNPNDIDMIEKIIECTGYVKQYLVQV